MYKVQEFVPCKTLTLLENSQARKAHFESEVARLNALHISNKLIGDSEDESSRTETRSKC